MISKRDHAMDIKVFEDILLKHILIKRNRGVYYMSNLDNFLRQHEDIKIEIKNMEDILEKSNYEKEIDKFVFHINNLAGKLRVHLTSEDKFLYPDLVNREDIKLRNLAKHYIEDMGDIFNQFSEYKNKFNTKSKIKNNNETFIEETNFIIDRIKKRIGKEEEELYKFI